MYFILKNLLIIIKEEVPKSLLLNYNQIEDFAQIFKPT
jgi:hypothetical protein